MKPDNTILSELRDISPYLAGLPRQVPYAAPLGYFENLPGILLQKAKLPEEPGLELQGLSPLLAGISKKSPFRAPEGYFGQIAEEVTAGVSAIEQTREVLESLHPLLETARKINPYRVPDQYFDEFPAIVLEKRPKPGKIIGIGKKWFSYAAAAAIIGLVAIAGWLYRPQGMQPVDNNGLSLQLEKEMNQLSDEVIFNFADSTRQLFNGSTANNDEDFNDLDMHILLEEVSDGALQQYLKEQPGKANLFNN